MGRLGTCNQAKDGMRRLWRASVGLALGCMILAFALGCAASSAPSVNAATTQHGVSPTMSHFVPIVVARVRLHDTPRFEAVVLVSKRGGRNCLDLQVVRLDGRGAQAARCLLTPSCGPLCVVVSTPIAVDHPRVLGGLVSTKATRLRITYSDGSTEAIRLHGSPPHGFSRKHVFVVETKGRHVEEVAAFRDDTALAHIP